ncbi:MAG: response regulator [Candidatus Marinimicrobia bacterium]|nr:response regulator [Candidatus Neomarinimicrobiota bacterium]
MLATDVKGQVVLTNQAAEKLTGWNQTEPLGRLLTDVLALVDPIAGKKVELPVAELLKGDLAAVPLRSALLVPRSGHQIPVTISISRLTDAQEQVVGLLVVIRDVSEKEKLETEMRKAQKLESLGLLAGGLAHDFNNFLMSIMLNVSSARMIAREQTKVVELLIEAERSVQRAKGITQQLMTFSRGGQPVKSNMYLTPLLKETVKFSLRGTVVQPRFQLHEDLWPVAIDPGQINQVLNNLVINAVQATPKGGTLTVSTDNIVVDAPHSKGPLSQGKYVEVTIRDEGVGIPAEILDQIYDPYFTTKDQGTGLGLFSVYSILEKHGGWISMKSRKDRGTTVRFYLPAASKPDAPLISATEMIVPGTSKILLMDDEEAIRRLLGQLLNDLGFNVETAPDGTTAVELFQASHATDEPFQAVIFDLMVPGEMDGVEAFKQIRQIDRDIKGIIMSGGHGYVAPMRQHEDFGFQAKLDKPFTTDELTEVLERVIKG